ncbi:unnamed protein product [Acanthosepion pharaonis]|uniref:HTH CENPB-type domain-containing protein n=1 Tax=Acanthosepion pharaonis TaxID=158019 RepID=A0A812DHC2_ACAPH|nr:unnamed protein product [Sepia pharaonis]
MSASASQRKTLSISEQLELIDDVKVKKLKLAAAAKKYGIGYSTAAKILKKEDDLRSCMQMNGNTNRKRKRQSVHKDVNEALTQWFTQACAQGATVTNHVIRQKASQLAVNLEVDFEPSNGWLMCWKQANNVSFKKFHGESTSRSGVVFGIIRSFKAYYRRELVRMPIAAIDATPPVPLFEVAKQITVLKAMHMMKRALFMVKPLNKDVMFPFFTSISLSLSLCLSHSLSLSLFLPQLSISFSEQSNNDCIP